MKLKKLLQEIPGVDYKGKDLDITGLCNHSKSAAPGTLFFAKKGSQDDGSRYIEEAIEGGASAVVTDFFNPFLKGVAQIIYPNVTELEALLAARFYDYPSEKLFTIGITGTCGKTTTSYLIRHLLTGLNHAVGMIGTIEYLIGEQRFPAHHTTPDVITNHKLLREMVKQGCDTAVMEVTSHGLAQKRCAHIGFDVALFTNLSQDHLDYHKTMEQYGAEKAKLFQQLTDKQMALVNADSPWSPQMLEGCRAPHLTYGLTPGADLYATDLVLGAEGSSFWVHWRGEKVLVHSPLIGRFNVSNCLAALLVCLQRGATLKELVPLLKSFVSAPGRLEKVDNARGLQIYVDFAHKPDSLQQVLATLGEIKQGRIITVVGCGGDRDRGKRPLMGRIADGGSDFTIITSDNPRSEDPLEICKEVASGCFSTHYTLIVDRRQAISRAVEMADPKDLILIAGKGHEPYQLFAHQTIRFDDREVAREIANQEFLL